MLKLENSLGLTSYDDKSRENTGRWTKEEHNLFLKGLELHGKGWKKIASLIKSRTVVQIRTHAQKYFLKLQKARHDGASGGYNDGRSNGYRKSKKRKYNDLPISLAQCLKPFIRVPTSTEDIETLNDTLYNFLSPQLDIYPSTSDESDRSSNYESKYQNKKSTNTNNANIPSWYKSGDSLANLIELAEKLNWIHDIGTPIADINLTNTMSPEVVEGTKPAVVLLPSPAVTTIPSFYSSKSSVSSANNNNVACNSNNNNVYPNINGVPSSSTSFSSDLAITSSPPHLEDSLDHQEHITPYNTFNNTFEEFIQNQNWMINYAPASIELSSVIETLNEHDHEDDLNTFGEGCVAYPECLQVF